MALRWHPRAIAELIRSRYQADYGWGDFWSRYDPENRALFYTRLFSGQVATGVDKLVDLNCVSEREKGYCTVGGCSCNLVHYRELLERRRDERLDNWPFNGMLLADEHF
jgi:hypothetical protein